MISHHAYEWSLLYIPKDLLFTYTDLFIYYFCVQNYVLMTYIYWKIRVLFIVHIFLPLSCIWKNIAAHAVTSYCIYKFFKYFKNYKSLFLIFIVFFSVACNKYRNRSFLHCNEIRVYYVDIKMLGNISIFLRQLICNRINCHYMFHSWHKIVFIYKVCSYGFIVV